MGKTLDGLRWKPMWVSHLGCVKGCVEFLGLDISDAWLFGGTGHAFIINLDEQVCPSGPTAWMTAMLGQLGANLGYVEDCVFGQKSEPGFADKQQQAWEFVRKAIDQGIPCYGWELEMPEFFVVYGYDAEGYLYSGPGCDEGKGPKPWRELGETEIGMIEMYSVARGEPADDVKTVKEALGFALEHAEGPEQWVFPKYGAGLAGYDNWINGLETGNVDGFGMAYNAAVWNECRGFAPLFLQEAQDRLGRSSAPFAEKLAEATEHYAAVARNLQVVADAFPFHGLDPSHIQDPSRRESALTALKAARKAEASGLMALRGIVDAL
jgi:hypothetical protein